MSSCSIWAWGHSLPRRPDRGPCRRSYRKYPAPVSGPWLWHHCLKVELICSRKYMKNIKKKHDNVHTISREQRLNVRIQHFYLPLRRAWGKGSKCCWSFHMSCSRCRPWRCPPSCFYSNPTEKKSCQSHGGSSTKENKKINKKMICAIPAPKRNYSPRERRTSYHQKWCNDLLRALCRWRRSRALCTPTAPHCICCEPTTLDHF